MVTYMLMMKLTDQGLKELKKATQRIAEGIKTILESYNEYSADKKIEFENIPSYNDLVKDGVNAYLR